MMMIKGAVLCVVVVFVGMSGCEHMSGPSGSSGLLNYVNVSCSSLVYVGEANKDCDVCAQFQNRYECESHKYSRNRGPDGCIYYGCLWKEVDNMNTPSTRRDADANSKCTARSRLEVPRRVCSDNSFSVAGRPLPIACKSDYKEYTPLTCPK